MTHTNKKVFHGDVCQSVDPGDLYEVFYKQRFLQENITLSLRPLCLPLDDAFIRGVAFQELPDMPAMGDKLFETKKIALEALAPSSLGNSFVGMADNQPVFLVVVQQRGEGDYLIELQRLPRAGGLSTDALASAIWHACRDCFVAFTEVSRLVSPLDPAPAVERAACLSAGFRFLAKSNGYDPKELFCYPPVGL